VSQLYVLQLASQSAQWLSARQSLIASNVANANTPGYRALDLQPFSAVLDNTQITMVTTDAAHMTPTQEDFASARAVESDPTEETLSGNSVNLEQEMIKLGEVNRAYSMGTNIKRAIHQMMMSALK
jgi:flagellar basal-body rod protein FlgB